MAENKALVQQVLQRYYGNLNPKQWEAVFQITGPVLILAGAGSGKTTVLIHRIQYMIECGDIYQSDKQPELSEEQLRALEQYVSTGVGNSADLIPLIARNTICPWNILAITFTNKAAQELKNRLTAKLGEKTARDIQASTFHSLCMRILRREIDVLGYERNFTVYDTDDSLRIIKEGLKAHQLDEKMLAPRMVLSVISKAKDSMLSAVEMLRQTEADYRENAIAKVYDYYQKSLKQSNALDFDDIILLTVQLFLEHPETLAYYQNRYRYIMVDEYQDTNQTQYKLVSLLAAKYQNLCVVGDDDQSIYKFRGATIENILSFEEQFEGAKVIRLEQNYRSTQHILTAANELIAHNKGRKGKNLWTNAGQGEKITVLTLEDETAEANYVADAIMRHIEEGGTWSDCAVLYRMNAQSGAVERAFAKRSIPYRIVGGVRFYERKEIKDMTAYFSVLNNPSDNLRLSRIINEPKRGIGSATMQQVQEIAETMGLSYFTVMKTADEYAPLSKKSSTLMAFTTAMRRLIAQVDHISLAELFDEVLRETGYLLMLEAEGKESISRIENIMELKSNMLLYEQQVPEATLGGFLEEIALYTDLDAYEQGEDTVTLMTIHAAKGLEFGQVYLVGMEEGIFPGRNAQNYPEEIEEERRLAYVAVTRAKQKLTLTTTSRRLLFGQTVYGRVSRFVAEMPQKVVDTVSVRPNGAFVSNPLAAKRQAALGQSIGVAPASAAPAGSVPNLKTGDKVSHKVFGDGVVLSAKQMGGDLLVEIDFAQKGVKKVMANFARLVKIES